MDFCNDQLFFDSLDQAILEEMAREQEESDRWHYENDEFPFD